MLRACELGYEFEEFEVGAGPLLRGEPALSEQTFQEAARADAILFGAIGDPRVPDVGYAAQVLTHPHLDLRPYAAHAATA